MLSKPTHLLLLIATLFLFTSCLDIFEDITLNKNGSGSYRLTMTVNDNVKSMMGNIEEAAKEDQAGNTTQSGDNPVNMAGEQVKDNFKELSEAIKKVKGVENFVNITDEKSVTFGYSFDFDNINTLNKCMEIAAGSKLANMPAPIGKGKKVYVPTARYIEWNKKTLIRHQSAELVKAMDMKKNDGSNAGLTGGLDVSYLFQDMKYVCTYQFDVPFKSFSNEASIVSEDNKKLSLECFPFGAKPKDEKAAKLADEACSQAVMIEF